MHRLLVALALTAALQAGTIQGVVLDYLSGRPLARTVIRLDLVPQGDGIKALSFTTRSGISGQFTFPSIAPGFYLLTALRSGYFPIAYGQRLPIGRGTAIEVKSDSSLFADLRMHHKGAVTGRVLDENGVPAEGISVVAYRARLPLRSAGNATSDDRGIYRVHGLDPGKYWIRSAAATLDDGSGWLPIFGSEAREAREARTHRVTVDSDTTDADIRPEPGRLFRLGGGITCDTTTAPIAITLSSETGRSRAQTSCPGGYQFEGLSPGVYEVFALSQDGSASGFLELFVDQNTSSGNVQVLQLPFVDIEVRRAGASTPSDSNVKLIGRRQDLSETETEREIKGPRTKLAPGHWELRAVAPPGQYVKSIVNLRGDTWRRWKIEHDSDWFEVFIEPRYPSRIRITLSDRAGQVAGSVIADSKPVTGAPVFLWPVAESARRSLSGPRQTLSDTQGRFHFESLPPGDYRVLASFDVNEIDDELIELSRAPTVHVEASQTAAIDLPVWIAP